jgi:hypothetical protein
MKFNIIIFKKIVEEGTTRVRQHWFIDSYIAAYIQVLYKGAGVHPNWFDGQ